MYVCMCVCVRVCVWEPDEFEATCADVESEKARALEDAAAKIEVLQDRFDGAKLKVRALIEELETERSRFEKQESRLKEQVTDVSTELSTIKLTLAKSTEVCCCC